MISYNEIDGYGRRLFSLSIQSLSDIPPELALPTRHFVCVLACDATNLQNEDIIRFASTLIDNGLAYSCVWGPDCSRVDGLIDLALVERELIEGVEYPIMTTSHAEESLDEALWFGIWVTFPDESYADDCGSVLVISVANPIWKAQIEERLTDPQQLDLIT